MIGCHRGARKATRCRHDPVDAVGKWVGGIVGNALEVGLYPEGCSETTKLFGALLSDAGAGTEQRLCRSRRTSQAIRRKRASSTRPSF